MMEKQGILVDLDRCVGCYACEVACKQENLSSAAAPWIRVHTIGPEFLLGKLKMDYLPLISNGCTFCQTRNLQPSCVAHCPTKALKVCSSVSILDALSGAKRYQVCMIK